MSDQGLAEIVRELGNNIMRLQAAALKAKRAAGPERRAGVDEQEKVIAESIALIRVLQMEFNG